MTKFFFSFFVLAFLFSCNSPQPSKDETASGEKTGGKDSIAKKTDSAQPKKVDFYTLEGDSLLVPPFEIEISLSPKARKRIVDGHESIVVAVFLSGTPKDSSRAQLEDDGSFYVSDASKEISYGETAKFDRIKFPRKIYDQLADKDPDLTVNVYTGRKSSKYNLIHSDLLADKLSKIINKRFTLQAKLIKGDDGR
jgi:hypothetical protein